MSNIQNWKGYDIQIVDIQPGDTLLVHVNDDVDLQSCLSIHKELEKQFPENTIIMCNEWVLKGMTILRQSEKIADVCNEIFIDQPLEELYPDLFGKGKTSGLKPGEIL